MKFNRILLSFFLILTFVLSTFTFAVNDIKSVDATGFSALTSDISKDRENAISDAQRIAVEMVVGTFVESKTIVENFVTIKDEIYTYSSGYVNTYQVLDEGQNKAEGTYWIKLNAEVSQMPIIEKLKAMGLLRKWRIMVLIDESYAGSTTNMLACETELIKSFKDAGYNVVDAKQVDKIKKSESAIQAIKGNKKSAVALAKRFGAEIIVTGKAIAEQGAEINTGGEGYGGMSLSFKSVRARVDLRAIRMDTGEIVATAAGEGSGADISAQIAAGKALAQAGKNVSEKLIQEVTLIPASLLQNIQLVIEGITYEKLQKLAGVLPTIGGVKRAVVQDFTTGVGRLEVGFNGGTTQLAAKLKSLKGYKLVVIAATQNRLDLKNK